MAENWGSIRLEGDNDLTVDGAGTSGMESRVSPFTPPLAGRRH
jgi:hypothetical protein